MGVDSLSTPIWIMAIVSVLEALVLIGIAIGGWLMYRRVMRTVSELEARGFVQRSPDPADGRAFFISATPAGEEAVLHARAERAQRISALLEELDGDGRAAILQGLDALEVIAGVTHGDADGGPRATSSGGG